MIKSVWAVIHVVGRAIRDFFVRWFLPLHTDEADYDEWDDEEPETPVREIDYSPPDESEQSASFPERGTRPRGDASNTSVSPFNPE